MCIQFSTEQISCHQIQSSQMEVESTRDVYFHGSFRLNSLKSLPKRKLLTPQDFLNQNSFLQIVQVLRKLSFDDFQQITKPTFPSTTHSIIMNGKSSMYNLSQVGIYIFGQSSRRNRTQSGRSKQVGGQVSVHTTQTLITLLDCKK